MRAGAESLGNWTRQYPMQGPNVVRLSEYRLNSSLSGTTTGIL